jgi:hypothetical protein
MLGSVATTVHSSQILLLKDVIDLVMFDRARGV